MSKHCNANSKFCMAFKLNNPPYNCDNTPIYSVDMEQGVLGKANNNGTIIINKDLIQIKENMLYLMKWYI
jgi:hypothetical protein